MSGNICSKKDPKKTQRRFRQAPRVKCSSCLPAMSCRWGRVVVVASFLTFLLHNGVLGTFGMYIPIFLEEFEQGSGQLGWVVSAGIAVECFAGPVGNFVVQKIGCRPAVMLGGALLACGTATASFATSIYHLFACIGLVAGLGGAIVHVGVVVVIGQYYNRHYTIANGIAYAGPGAGVVVFPPLIQYLNEIFDWRQCLIIEAAIVSNVIVLGTLLRPALKTKPRLRKIVRASIGKKLDYLPVVEEGVSYGEPDASKTEMPQTNLKSNSAIDFQSESSLRFCNEYLMQTNRTRADALAILAVFAACVFHTAGYSGVSVHLVNQAISSGMSPRQASILLSCIGLGSLVGRLSHGWFLTRKCITAPWMYTLSLLVSAAVMATLPITTNLGGKFASATTVGICSGVYFSLVAVLLRELVGILYLGVAFGISLFCSGVGTTLGGCVIGVLRDATGSYCIPSYLVSVFFAVAAILSLPRPVIQWYQSRSIRFMEPLPNPTSV